VKETGPDGTSDEGKPFDQDGEPFEVRPLSDREETVHVEPIEVDQASEPAPATEVQPEPSPDRVFAGTGISWAFIFGAILTAAIIILAVQNTDSVPVKLYFWETEAPLIIVMLVTALVVVLIDEMIGLIIRRRRRRVLAEREELKRLRAQAGQKGLEIQ
jgi:uncharacterized integral membrane protein